MNSHIFTFLEENSKLLFGGCGVGGRNSGGYFGILCCGVVGCFSGDVVGAGGSNGNGVCCGVGGFDDGSCGDGGGAHIGGNCNKW